VVSSEQPREIGPYRVVGVLGQGGAGAVYSCVARDGRQVAVKLVRLLSPDDALRFERECRLQVQLGGDGLLPIYDAGRCPLGAYAVTPLATGGTLRDRLRHGGPLPWDEAARLVRRLAEVAGRMHAAGIVHRDLKPDNVLFSGDGQPWIADLGLSKHTQGRAGVDSISLSATGQFAGSPGYMAPEQAMDAKSVGPAADVFALGAILYTALTGAEPFNAANATAAVALAASGSFKPLPASIPDYVVEAATRAMAPQPEDRPPTGAALANLLDPGRAAGPVPPRRGAGPRLLVVLVLLTLTLAILTWAVLRGRPVDAAVAEVDTSPSETPADPAPPAPPAPDPPPPDPPPPAPPAPDPPAPDPPAPDPPAPKRDPSPRAERVFPAPGGHTGLVREVRVAPSGTHVLSGSIQGELILHDLRTGEPAFAWQTASRKMIEGIAFAQGGYIHACSVDGNLYRGRVGEPLSLRPSGHKAAHDLDMRGDGRRLVVGGDDGLRFWRGTEGPHEDPPPLLHRGPVHVARFHPKGGGLALGAAGAWR